MKQLKLISLFSGTGGLDRGFENASFKIVWANEFDKTIWPSFQKNFPKTKLDTRSIVEIDPNEAPDCDGIIGGPPCQSWSEAGAARGINDPRGRLFNDYVKFIKAKKPKRSSVPQPPATNVPELSAVNSRSERMKYMSAYGLA